MKTKLHPMFEEARGALGDLVYREAYGKTVVSRKPIANGGELSAGQMEHRERFMQAVAYGKSALADMNIRPLYEAMAKIKKMPIFAVSIADFFNAPTIHEVDVFGYSGNIGDTITVRASDDIGVAKVYVSISKPDGDPIENGEAIETAPGSGQWVYTATVQGQPIVKVQAVAVDRPGGTAIMNIDKTF